MTVRHRRARPLIFAIAAVLALASFTLHAQLPVPPPPPPPSDALFNSDVVNRIDLRVNSTDWEKLKREFQTNEYYPADVVFNGQTARNVGIRSRGLGSRSGTKPGLRVDFDRYTTSGRFLGLKSFVLDNLVQDPSGVRETLAMKLFARLGIPAPREAHVRLYVNNQYAGLYAAVESIDKDFLARIYGSIGDDVQNDGFLFEFNYVDPWRFTYLGPDLEQYKLRFDIKTNESRSDQEIWGPIETLVRLANEIGAEQYLEVLGERLDLPGFMRYVAAQNFVGQTDGFLGYEGMNNFYFYRLENSSRHAFIAWDEDNAFVGPTWDIRTRHDENVLMQKAMQVRELSDIYFASLADAMRSADELTGPDGLTWLEFEARRQTDLIYEALRDDPVKPYTMDQHDNNRVGIISFAQQRSRFVQEQLGLNQPSRRPVH